MWPSWSILYCCFVDFRSAFDSISRISLVYKLLKMNVNNNFLKIIRDMYSNVSYSIKNAPRTRIFYLHENLKYLHLDWRNNIFSHLRTLCCYGPDNQEVLVSQKNRNPRSLRFNFPPLERGLVFVLLIIIWRSLRVNSL